MNLRAVLALALLACGKSEPARTSQPTAQPVPASDSAVAPVEVLSPNQLFGRGNPPTFVLGTAGDDHADRNIAGQAEMVRANLFPTAARVNDSEIVAGTWPAFPVVYGGSHVNALIAATKLPLEITAGRLAIGGEVFEGDDYVIYTAIPAAAERPAFVLFAGTGTPGTDSINSNLAVGRGDAVIMIADAFGPLVTGTWRPTSAGAVEAVLGKRAPRPAPRATRRETWNGVAVEIHMHEGLPTTSDAALVEVCKLGIAKAATKLEIQAAGAAIEIHAYPDAEAKRTRTGYAGNGHAIAYARALHVVALPGLESLIAHEATHVLAPQAWGVSPTAMIGEGLAVWVSGKYGQRAIADWATYLKGAGEGATITQLLGRDFARMPEARSYPNSAIAVQLAIEKVGLDKFREHLYGATALDWTERCQRAGTTAATLDEALAAAVGPSKK